MITQDTISRLNALGYYIINKDELLDKDVNDKISIIDDNGYKYFTTPKHILANHRPFIVYKDNVYSIENIKLYLRVHKNEFMDFELLATEYKDARQKLTMKCNRCNNIITKNWNKIQSGCVCTECLKDVRGYLQMTSSHYTDRLIDYPTIAADFDNDNNEFSLEVYTAKSGKQVNWKCAKCGHKWTTAPYHRIRDNSGCPACANIMSKAERLINDYLSSHNVNYCSEKVFYDCRDKKPLPFDFYLPDIATCIEYDGEQHRTPVRFSSKMSDEEVLDNFKLLQLHDKIKTDYCNAHNITLIRITDYNNIKSVLDDLIEGKIT